MKYVGHSKIFFFASIEVKHFPQYVCPQGKSKFVFYKKLKGA